MRTTQVLLRIVRQNSLILGTQKTLSTGTSRLPEDYFSKDYLLTEENVKNCNESLSNQPSLFPGRRAATGEDVKKAAVLIPLVLDKDDRICLLYTKRSMKLGHHRGEVCFPGGRQDKTDADIEDTASRETAEELGIGRHKIKILGSLKPVGDKNGETAVYPVYGTINIFPFSVNCLNFNRSEVESAFFIPLETLANKNIQGYTQFVSMKPANTNAGYSLPVFDTKPYKVWGMTAIMTWMFLKGFLHRSVYNHRVKYHSKIR